MTFLNIMTSFWMYIMTYPAVVFITQLLLFFLAASNGRSRIRRQSFKKHRWNWLTLDPHRTSLPVIVWVKWQIQDFPEEEVNPLVGMVTYSSFSLITQIWHFWHFCTKLTSRAFKISKNKVASTGNNTSHLWIRISTALTTQPPKHLLNRRSLNWAWIISGSIEHDFIRGWKFETAMDWQIGWVGKQLEF